ncbi:MAG: cupin domain-containing protein [Verrucomicrobiota bacterium]
MLRRFVAATETEVEEFPGQLNRWYFKDGLGDAENLALVRGCLAEGGGHPFHNHPEMDEIIYVLSGEMRQWLETESRILRAGDSLYIPRGVIHGCKNEQATPCEFLAILTPGKIVGPLSVDYSNVEPWVSLL